MKRKLLYIPLIHYTDTKYLEKIMSAAKEKWGEYRPLFLDPANCQYNGNEIRIKQLEKEIKDPIICFGNFTRTLKEANLWWHRNTQRWDVYFWCKDETIRSVYEMTNLSITKGTSIKRLYEEDKLNQFGYLK